MTDAGRDRLRELLDAALDGTGSDVDDGDPIMWLRSRRGEMT